MIIAIKHGVSREDAREFTDALEKQGVKVNFSGGAIQTVLGLVGDTTVIEEKTI
ncbi:hypothetical protein AGMMS50293_29530 [Spirochaetia bacterium]|nr:hypothetical protein AGMMS50293_29530 [Spirochaetia bacterium]